MTASNGAPSRKRQTIMIERGERRARRPLSITTSVLASSFRAHMHHPDDRAANHRDPETENHRHDGLSSEAVYRLVHNPEAISRCAPGFAVKVGGQLYERCPYETE